MTDLGLQADLALRLLIAAGLGAAVGVEREIHGHPAGMRTHLLVALGAGLFTVLSVHGFEGLPGGAVDPSRVAAQIVAGIGFLGAGAILKDGVVVRGLTTAASLWATAAIGMAAAAGQPILAVVATVIVVISLWPLNAVADRIHGSSLPEVRLRLELARLDRIGDVTAALGAARVDITSVQTERLGKGRYRADLVVRGRRGRPVATALETLGEIPDVDVVSTSEVD